MSAAQLSFADNFCRLTGYSPMRWQSRLFGQLINGEIPAALDLPTGLGKTSVMAMWLLARAFANAETLKAIPRRLIYVVDRRAVVDQATEEAEKLRDALDCNARAESKAEHLKSLPPDTKEQAFATLRALKKSLGIDDGERLPISTLRGAHVDNREWLEDPVSPAIVVGTVDMIGSRLLFEGYGVSRKMRPYHAGLLGADTLIVLDEAHLVPPFAHLLAAIENGQGSQSRDQGVVPGFRSLPLSATQRNRPDGEGAGQQPFLLEDTDVQHDDVAEERFYASKCLYLEPAVDRDWDSALAEKAWELATKNNRFSRVVVFCNRRDKKDDESTGPSVMGVLEQLQTLAKQNKRTGVTAFDLAGELLVGGRRVKERQDSSDNLKRLGFAGRGENKDGPDKPTFLLATSAGEVGVDFDADHMVSDLAPWERMVQRLGRVNRKGGKDRHATVIVFDSSQTEKNDERKTRLKRTLGLLERLGAGGQASSASLIALRKEAGEKAIEDASTPEPLRPALTRALVDAWSMTSLERHTGRPDVAPWLRGWVDNEKPRTTVVWRALLPVRMDEEGRQFVPTKEANDFFEAAPPHESEKLESETFRVVEWMEERARALTLEGKAATETPEEDQSEAKAIETSTDDHTGDKAAELEHRAPSATDIVALTLSPAGDFERFFTLGTLARPRKDKREKDEFFGRFVERTLVLDSRFRGLAESGMLNPKSNAIAFTADADEAWGKEAGFRVSRSERKKEEKEEPTEDERKIWRPEFEFVVRRNGDTDDPAEWLVVEHYKDCAQSEDGRSVRNVPQELGQHQSWAEQKARDIASKIGLSGPAAEALAVAAFLHDEGKRASRWQRAFRAPHEKDEAGAYKIFAKTRGPINEQILDGYRHEFGSLAYTDAHTRFKALPEAWRDLVLHLIAAHHGRARPVISTRGCEDAPPSALEERACEVALRFARLQKRWGPWGLAWWEALLRAADQQASRDNDRGEGLGASPGEEG